MNELKEVVTLEKLRSLESGMYSATNEDGKTVIIFRQKGKGWSIQTPTHHDWYETVDYDENGEQESVSYGK